MAYFGKAGSDNGREEDRSFKDRQVLEHAVRFKRMAPGIAQDEVLRREHSREHRVITLGESAVATLLGSVKDFDGSDRRAMMRIDLRFHDDGAKIDYDNMHLARRAEFWSSLAEGDRQNVAGSRGGNHNFDRMSAGVSISMIGETAVTEVSEFQHERKDFRATQILVGNHSADDLRASMKSDLGMAAERFVAAKTYLEQEAIALAYARRVVEAIAPGVVIEAPASIRAKGPVIAEHRADYVATRVAGAGR